MFFLSFVNVAVVVGITRLPKADHRQVTTDLHSNVDAGLCYFAGASSGNSGLDLSAVGASPCSGDA